MKKFISLLFFAALNIAAFCSVSDSTAHAALVSAGLSSTVAWLIVTGIGLIFSHVAIPNKFASILYYIQLAITWINEKTNNGQVKNFYKGASIILLFFMLSAGAANAQSPWSGFLKPIKENQVLKNKMYSLTESSDDTNSLTSGTWLFRPSLSLTAVLVDLKTKDVETLNSVGTGISYGNFTTTDGTAYCNYSFNASILTQVTISGTTTANFGGAISADVFNKTIGLLIGYLGTSGFADGHIVIGTSFSYSF
jgi:hypothetical protein